MYSEVKVKEFCKTEHYDLIDEILDILNISGDDIKLITTRNAERAKIIISKFKYNKNLLDKNFAVMYGDISTKELCVNGEFAFVYMTAYEHIFNKVDRFKQILIFER